MSEVIAPFSAEALRAQGIGPTLETSMKPFTIGLLYNNPGYIRFSENIAIYPGFYGTDSAKKYAQFFTPEDGVRAMYRLMGVYIKQTEKKGILSPRGFPLNTIKGLIDKWAKRGDLQTEGFINFVSEAAGKDPNDLLTHSDKETFGKIIQAIIDFENSIPQGRFYIEIVPRALEGYTHANTTFPPVSSGNPNTVVETVAGNAPNNKNTDR